MRKTNVKYYINEMTYISIYVVPQTPM